MIVGGYSSTKVEKVRLKRFELPVWTILPLFERITQQITL